MTPECREEMCFSEGIRSKARLDGKNNAAVAYEQGEEKQSS